MRTRDIQAEWEALESARDWAEYRGQYERVAAYQRALDELAGVIERRNNAVAWVLGLVGVVVMVASIVLGAASGGWQ